MDRVTSEFICWYRIMVLYLLAKQMMRVQFPLLTYLWQKGGKYE